MSVEVKVTRSVSDDVWSRALKTMFEALIYDAAALAQSYAPTDMGKLKQSLNPQSAQVDGSAWPQWAKYGPKGAAAKYGGYLNAGSYVRRKRPPKAVIHRWLKLRGNANPTPQQVNAVWWNMKPGKRVTFHYIGQPSSSPLRSERGPHGLMTKGWFNPNVKEAMERGPAQKAADDFAAAIERAWNR
jgi:hypothetical protein